MQKSKLQVKNQNWEIMRFSDIAEFINGGALRHNGMGLPIIKIKQLKEGIKGAERTDNYLREEYRVFNGDFLMPWSTDLDIYKWNYGEAYLNQHIFKVIPKEEYDKNFVFYIIKYWRRKLATHLHGSTMQHIKREALDEEKFPVPQDINEQKRIADILSAFDDKIELNNKIRRTLEEMANAIFKEWFVNFRFPGWEKIKFVNSKLGKIPEGWEVSELGQIMNLRRERIKKFDEWRNLKLLDLGRFPKKSLSMTIFGKGEEMKTSVFAFKKMDILFGAVRPYFHKVLIAPFDGITNSSVFVIYPKENIFYSFLLTILFSDTTISHATKCASGTKMPVVKWRDLCDIQLMIPEKELVKLFESKAQPFYKKIIKNVEENQALSSLRDLLLPKLMSGEVRIKV